MVENVDELETGAPPLNLAFPYDIFVFPPVKGEMAKWFFPPPGTGD